MTIPSELVAQARTCCSFGEVRRSVVTPSVLTPFVTLAQLEQLCDTEDLGEVLQETVMYCIRYMISVTQYFQAQMADNPEVLREVDKARKHLHDATADQINILARTLKCNSRENTWVAKLAGNRAAYAKFALLLAFERLEQGQGKETMV